MWAPLLLLLAHVSVIRATVGDLLREQVCARLPDSAICKEIPNKAEYADYLTMAENQLKKFQAGSGKDTPIRPQVVPSDCDF